MIVVDRVGHGFEGRTVLDEVSFRVAPHELVCLVGASGCGKTTLLRIMAGLLQPSTGTVFVDREEVLAPSARTAMVFQHFGLFPWKSVRANVAYGMANRGIRDAGRVDALLKTMGLEDAADRYPRQLSGGMQQRVGLARALAVEPRVLLMDEPFGSLDAITREQLQSELLRIWEQDPQVTGVFVTHDIDEALLLGDRVLAMRPGPGRVHREIQVSFSRPRRPQEVRARPEYASLRAELWEALRPPMVTA